MTKKRGLGRGLGALIPAAETAVAGEDIRLIAVADIIPNPHQPRTAFNEEQLAELAASITEHGLIQPLVVTRQGDQYVLIAGERRWRACQRAELETVPVIVKEATPQAMLELALVENIQRADLNALEEAYAYQQLMSDFGLTQEEVARRVGKGRSTVANLVRLLSLPTAVQQAVSDGQISGAHGRALLPLPTPESQTSVLNQIIKLDLSVRQTYALVEKLMSGKKPKPKQKPSLPPNLMDIQEKLQSALSTRVNITKQGKGGRVTIHYYSDEDLQTIYDMIIGQDLEP